MVAKAHLEHQLAGLTETMKEKEEDYKMQVRSLHTMGAVHVLCSLEYPDLVYPET